MISKCRTLSVAEAAYLAGLIDGEGSIFLGYFKKPSDGAEGAYVMPRVAISNTSKPLLTYTQNLIGGGKIYNTRLDTPKKGWRACYQFILHANGCRELLPQLIPYIVLKKKQAELLIEFLSLVGHGKTKANAANRTRSNTIGKELTILNSRGILKID